MPFDIVVDMLSLSIKPHIVVGVVTVWDKPLKHVVDVLICDDRQCGVPASTKLSRIIPTLSQHWTVRVETIFLIVHWVALGEGRYDIYDVQQNQQTSCTTSECMFVTEFIAVWHNNRNHQKLFSINFWPNVWLVILHVAAYSVVVSALVLINVVNPTMGPVSTWMDHGCL